MKSKLLVAHFSIISFCILVSIMAILGWVLSVEILTTLGKSFPSMKFNTALCFLISGVAILKFKKSHYNDKVIIGLGLVLGVVSFLTLLQYVFNTNFGIDELFLEDEFSIHLPGRMSPATALLFFLLAIVITISTISFSFKNRIVSVLLHFIGIVSFLSLLTYIFSIRIESKISFLATMAVHTSTLFMVYAILFSLQMPYLGVIKLLLGDSIGNKIVRRLFLKLIASLFIVSSIVLYFFRVKQITGEFAIMLFCVLIFTATLFILYRSNVYINKLGRLKDKAETDFKRVKTFLDATPDPVMILNQENKVVRANSALLTVFQYDENEILNEYLTDLIPERFHNKYEKHLEKYQSENLHEAASLMETFAVKKCGEEFPVEISLNTLKLSNQTYTTVAFRDITKRKKAESNYFKVNELLDTALEASIVGVWDYDLTTQQMHWDKVVYNLYGLEYVDENNVTSKWQKAVHPEDLSIVEENFKKSLRELSDFDASFRVVWPDQTVKYIKAKARIFYNKNKRATRFLGTTWDVTKQKEYENELINKNEQNLLFVKQAPSAIAMFDTDMRYLAASDKWIKDYNISSDIIGKSHYEVFPEIGEDWKETHQKCLKGHIDIGEEEIFERADGSRMWITWEVRPWYKTENEVGGLLMYTANITSFKENVLERLRIQNMLEKSNEIARIGIWELDLQKQKLFWDETTKEIHEVAEDYIPTLETSIKFYKTLRDQVHIKTAVEKAIEKNIAFDLEIQIVTAKNKEKWVRSIGQGEIINGKCVKVYGIFQDITENRNAQEEIKDLLKTTIEQNDRLKNFAHIVSHNLRSHSSNIDMLVSILKEENETAATNQIFTFLKTASNNLSETIIDLNEVVQINTNTSESLEKIDLNTAVEKAIQSVTSKAISEKVKIQNNLNKELNIKAIPAYLTSILLNMLTNAIKYKNPHAKASWIKISFEESPRRIYLKIEDNGLGIDLKKHGEKIFGMYKTFHQHEDSKGIGLFITKNQIEAIGGKVEVESEPFKGTIFTISFLKFL